MSLNRSNLLGSSTPSNSARKSFKSPFRTPTQTDTPDLSSNSGINNINNSEPALDESTNNCTTPKRNIGLKRKAEGSLSSRKSFKVPFKSPLINKLNNNCDKNSTNVLSQLLEKGEKLDEEISNLENEGHRVEELQEFIDQLHKYNEIKDAAQIVMGRIAEIEESTIKDIHNMFDATDID